MSDMSAWPPVPLPADWTLAGPGHDDQCESEFISGPNAMSPCARTASDAARCGLMARYVLLRIEDDQEADDLLRELASASSPFVRSPRTDDVIHVEVVPGLDAGDDRPSIGELDVHGLSLETAIGWSYERGPELAAEWEAAS